MKLMKNGKAASADGILPEFIKNLRPKGKRWLSNIFSYIKNSNTLPKISHQAKVIAILKPGKPGHDLKNYRSISLLSVIYKRFERVLLKIIQAQIEKALLKEQVGFKQGRSCCKQVLSLVWHVKNGLQKRLKSGAVFLDLTSAYDTVWKRGLLLKFTKILKI